MNVHIKFDNIILERTIPDNWNSLTLRDLLFCYQLIMQPTPEGYTDVEAFMVKRLHLARYFLKLDDAMLDRYRTEIADDVDYFSKLTEIAEVSNFLFDITTTDAGSKQFSIALALTKCPYPTLTYTDKGTGRNRRLYAAADELRNVSIYELGYILSLYDQHLADPENVSIIDRLIATIYRPAKEATQFNLQSGYQGDIRQPLIKHETMVDRRMKHLATIPPQTKEIILFWIAGCRRLFVSKFPNVFKAAEAIRDPDAKDYGFAGLLLQLSDGLPNLDSVAVTSANTAFTYLSYLEDQRLLAELKRTNP